MNKYASLISPRCARIDSIETWQWITTDHGAFDGPMNDWIESHKAVYLKHVTDWSVVVQAGGNCGMYPALFAHLFKTVYTFEPDPLNFYALVQNTQFDNIIKMQAALGDHHGMIEVHRQTMQNVGMHTVRKTETAFIPQLCIDDLALPSCGLIQLDIEGYEIHALTGARNTIEKFKPVIACERADEKITQFLSARGYSMVGQSKMDAIYKVL